MRAHAFEARGTAVAAKTRREEEGCVGGRLHFQPRVSPRWGHAWAVRWAGLGWPGWRLDGLQRLWRPAGAHFRHVLRCITCARSY
eukprot:109614-Chlamydomonas_euryale.AAC.4